MQEFMQRLKEIAKRGDMISAQQKIKLLEFDLAVQTESVEKMDSLRVHMHQLVDDQLDLQVAVKHLKNEHEDSILDRMQKEAAKYMKPRDK